MLDHDRIIADQAEAIAAVAEAGDPSAPVPGTDWSLAGLLDHVGRLSWFWAGRTRRAGGGDFYDTDRPDDVTVADFIRQGATTMREQLAAAAPDAEIKTFAGMRSPTWLQRRMVHELTVHRWDAEAAVGTAAPVATEIAEDGVDEFLDGFAAIADLSGVGGSIHLHATDGDGEWFLGTADGLAWTRTHEKGDVAVRGTTSDLLLLLWGRIGTDAVEVLGDGAVLDRWRAATRF
jgi:uncharacterized protein (TIGR03083 family)